MWDTWRNTLKTQHIHIVWLLMKKCPNKIREHTSERRLSTQTSPQMIDRAGYTVINEAGPTDFHWWNCTNTASSGVNRSLSYTNWRRGTCRLKKLKQITVYKATLCSVIIHSLEAFLPQKSYDVDMMAWNVFLQLSPHSGTETRCSGPSLIFF